MFKTILINILIGNYIYIHIYYYYRRQSYFVDSLYVTHCTSINYNIQRTSSKDFIIASYIFLIVKSITNSTLSYHSYCSWIAISISRCPPRRVLRQLSQHRAIPKSKLITKKTCMMCKPSALCSGN